MLATPKWAKARRAILQCAPQVGYPRKQVEEQIKETYRAWQASSQHGCVLPVILVVPSQKLTRYACVRVSVRWSACFS